jgi:hypothetical protein
MTQQTAMPDEPQETPEQSWEDEEQPLINTDPMRPPQNTEERRIVAPDPDAMPGGDQPSSEESDRAE